MCEHARAYMEKQEREKRQANGKQLGSMVSKNDLRYWEKRVFRPKSFRAGGRVDESPFYSVKLQHLGQRIALSLATSDRREAAALAKERYFFLLSNGWSALLSKYRPVSQKSPEAQPSIQTTNQIVTVGQYLEAVKKYTDLSAQTIEAYAKPFRQIVAAVTQIRSTRSRFDYRSGGYQRWVEKVHAVQLSELGGERITVWKKAFIARAGSDELLRRRYTVSANSMLRQARSLFSKRNVLSRLNGIQLPTPLPFEGVNVERRTDTKFYGCGVASEDLFRDAITELGNGRAEELKAFLLALVLGLRRREVDLLEWQSFDFVASTVRIMPTRWYQLKTNESAAVLLVEPEIMSLFRGWFAQQKADAFVIRSDRQPKAVAYQWYRCQEVFDALLEWLRSKGVTSQKPFHALRKLYGSAVADKHGLHAASSGLRHSDIRTTAEFYADRTVKVTAGFGALLSGASVSVLPGTGSRKGSPDQTGLAAS
jgi:integrase